MPEFFIIIARKIFSPNFRGNVPPAPVSYPYDTPKKHCGQLILYQINMGVNNWPRVAARQCTGRELNWRPIDRESNAIATTLPSHHKYHKQNIFYDISL